MTDLTTELREGMIQELSRSLNVFIISEIVEHMPARHLELFTRLHEENRPQAEINIQEAMTRSVSAKFREVRKAIDEHGRGDGKQKALDELDNITHQVPVVNELATQTFDTILNLLGKNIKPTAKMKEQVVERALTKRAPFQREKTSVADAVIIEMYAAEAKAGTDSDRYCFITHESLRRLLAALRYLKRMAYTVASGAVSILLSDGLKGVRQ